MMMVTYRLDREKIRDSGGIPPADAQTTISCSDETQVSFVDGLLTVTGPDVLRHERPVRSFTVTYYVPAHTSNSVA